MVFFNSEREASYWICSKMPYSSVSIIMHVHAVSRSVLNWTNFRFRVMISFFKFSHLVQYTFAGMNFVQLNKHVIGRYVYIEFVYL